jgi:NADPH:quinone reductase-like Zn-dependent oxidoreductase
MSISSVIASVTKTMKAEVIDRYGEPNEVMRTATVPVPELANDELLIEVHSAGVGAWDPELCRGEFGREGGLPRVLGSDGAGTVVRIGSGVRDFEVGDRVYSFGLMNPKGGFYAEYAAVSANEAAKVPPMLSLEQAAVLAADGLTALAGLDTLEIARDQKLMIIGASGGVGHLALQLAKRIGARVLAVASGSDGVELARRLGADDAIDGRGEDVAAEARALSSEGLDAALVFAGTGAGVLLELVRKGGRIAYPNGVDPVPQGRPGIPAKAFDGYHGREALERLNRLVSAGSFHVEVSRTYALEDTPKALADTTRHHLGKLAVTVH